MLPNPDNYNTANLTDSLLGPYCNRSTGIYKCPGDKVPGAKGPRVRSISMNGMMGGISTQTGGDQPIRRAIRTTSFFTSRGRFINPSPVYGLGVH